MTPPRALSALEKNPELAKKIGVLMGEYASIEYKLFIVYVVVATAYVETVTDAEVKEGFSRYYKLRSVNLKCQLVMAVVDLVLKGDSYRDLNRACVRVCRRMKGAARRRTDVAHCVFMLGGDAGVVRLSAARSEPTFEPVTEQYLSRTQDQFRTLGQDLLVLVSSLIGTADRLMNLLRALPVPPGIPLPEWEEGLDGPTRHVIEENKASLVRLGLPHAHLEALPEIIE